MARHLVGALSKGKTASCIGYRRSHHRLDDSIDRTLNAIDLAVTAALPAVQCSRYQRPDGERVWVWSLGEPKGVAFFPRQDPEVGIAYFPQGELGGDAYWVPSQRQRAD